MSKGRVDHHPKKLHITRREDTVKRKGIRTPSYYRLNQYENWWEEMTIKHKDEKQMDVDTEIKLGIENFEDCRALEKTNNTLSLSGKTIEILTVLHENNLKGIVVGGTVRDFFINTIFDSNIENKDIDIEVYGEVDERGLISILEPFGDIDFVGKSFGVFKLSIGDDDFDISFPRRENNTGVAHKEVEIIVDTTMSYKEAFKRRDFTMNAIGYDFVSDSFIDEYDGVKDIEKRLIRRVDEKTFQEDPLRVYRALQFSARLQFKLEDNTSKLIKRMVEDNAHKNVTKERVFEELKKILIKARYPSLAFVELEDYGLLKSEFKEVYDLKGVIQGKRWHPEGDVYIHTLMVIDAMRKNMPDVSEKKQIVLMLAALCHDFGKARYTKISESGVISSIGHEEGGIKPTMEFIERFTNDKGIINEVSRLVRHHIDPVVFYAQNSKRSAISRLSKKVNFVDLLHVAKADQLGRTTPEALRSDVPFFDFYLNNLDSYKIRADGSVIEDNWFISGKDLLDMGMKPGVGFKEILLAMKDVQVNGEVETREEALEWMKDVYC